MFRIVKVSATRLQGRYDGGSSRLYRTIRYYSDKQRSELCPPPAPKKTHTGTAFTIGALALASGAIIGYAKYDPDFRCHLTEYVPFTDGVIKVVFQEEKTYSETLTDAYNSLRLALLSQEPESVMTKKRRKVHDEPQKDYQLDPKQEVELPEDHPKNLAELEKTATEAAKKAMDAYAKAKYAIQVYVTDIEIIVEESVDNLQPQVWQSLKEKTEEKDMAINEAEKEARLALLDFKRLRDLLHKENLGVPDAIRDQALRNMDEVAKDLDTAKNELEDEKKKANVTHTYWQKVKEARTHFSDELEILFPKMDIMDKKVSIEDGDLDLFVLHAMAKVLYYQKELYRLETIGTERLNRAVEAAKRGGLDVLTTEQICNELEKEKRTLEAEFQKKCLKMRNESELELRRQLKTQSAAFADHLSDALKVQEAELEKRLTRNFDEMLTEQRCQYKEELAVMIGKLRGLDHALKTRNEVDRAAHQAQVLWAACQALYRAVKAGCPGFPWSEQIRPLDPEIKAVKLAAADGDELVKVVLEGIPLTAKTRGVYPEDALRERFIKVEKIARGVALVPENGGRLHLYLMSYLQSFLLLKAANPIPQTELNDDETDFTKLSTNDILQRARYWIDRGDFSQTLKYMNLLQGAPRAVARQWMEETKILLETQQAANTLMAHATATGLIHL